MKRIIFICTGNSCRSQMAEGLLKSVNKGLEVHSAGIRPEASISPNAVQVMMEVGIKIDSQYPKHIYEFNLDSFDYIIALCDNADRFLRKLQIPDSRLIHISVPDPADAAGSADYILDCYRKARNDISQKISNLFDRGLSNLD